MRRVVGNYCETFVIVIASPKALKVWRNWSNSQGGVRRIAYSSEDIKLATQQHWMIETGMSVRLDTAGNIIGRYPGTFPKLLPAAVLILIPFRMGRYDGHLESWQDWKSCVSRMSNKCGSSLEVIVLPMKRAA